MTLYLKNAKPDQDEILNNNSQYKFRGIKNSRDEPSEKSKI